MVRWTLMFTALAVAAHAEPDSSYLTRTVAALHACRADIPDMKAPADAAAKRLADGGALWAAGYPAWVSELSGRAGGIMLIKNLGNNTPQAGDVVLFGGEPGVEVPANITGSGALVIGFGSQPASNDPPWFPNHAADADVSPTLANLIPAWIFSAELVGALTRLDKMPVMYETIGLPGGFPRIYKYQREGVFWHEKNDVPPITAGVLGNRYADGVKAILLRADQEDRDGFNEAATWAADALNDGHHVIMYGMGHFVPDEIQHTEIGKDFQSGVWNSGFSYLKTPDDKYSKGDVLIHIGYQHPPNGLLKAGREAGARVVYVDILRNRDYVNDPGVLWIDPMWPWSDACVTLEGYDIPILPPSGIVNCAIAWEIHRLTRKKLKN